MVSTSLKILLTTHSLCFISGIVVGKSVDAKELAGYRAAHRESTERWRKRMLLMSVGISSLVFVSYGARKIMKRKA